MISPSHGVLRRLHTAVWMAIVCACGFAEGAHAQNGNVQDWQRRLDERDKVIFELMRRVEALERKLGAREVTSTPPPQEEKRAAAQPPQEQAAAGMPATEVDEEQGARALERALLREGGLVLPRGVYEIEPAFTYRERETQGLTALTIGGVSSVALQVRRRDTFETSLGVRVGLPWSSQLGIRMPYVVNRLQADVVGVEEKRQHQSGWGDVELAWTTQFARERQSMPSLLGIVSWTARTGGFELGDADSPGIGFHTLQAGLTAVKRQDPMVFYGSLSRGWRLGRTIAGVDIEPGDTIGLKLGTILAASPETSLRLAFDVSRTARTRVNGQKTPGTDMSVGILELGLGSVLSARTILDLRVGIGLTSDAPNYRIDVALPVRFH